MKRLMGHTWPGGVWFRVYGRGLNVHLRRHHVALFSERNGYVRWYYLGPICFRFLRKADLLKLGRKADA